MIKAFRLARKKYATPLSGKGAALRGGRWNSVGAEMLYLASNRSLAMAEVAVHLTLATIPTDYVMVTIEMPESISIKVLSDSDFPEDWNLFPFLFSTQRIGDKFIAEGKHCILKVPSAVTRGDYNLLVNPRHPDFELLKVVSIEEFPFDRRIFK